ncbi:DUF885 family protein [bacterium]|nr:MAG: DUF885 family protein [bacterium]
MAKQKLVGLFLCLLIALSVATPAAGQKTPGPKAGGTHDDLIAMFKELREIEKPVMKDGVPDYTPAGMKEQKRKLEAFKKRLAAMDTSSWTVPQRSDYLLVRAEANGLEFNHRVIRPWSRDPGFYAVFGQFQPVVCGALEVPKLPVPADKVAVFRAQLLAVPKLLAQGRKNLTEPTEDLALLAIDFKNHEIERLKRLKEELAAQNPDLVPDADKALAAVEDYKAWLEKDMKKMAPHAGIGIENYNWYVKNVWLLPYTWQDLLAISQRELERAVSHMKLEEHRNRALPPLKVITDEKEFVTLYNESQKFLWNFVRNEDVMNVPEWMKPRLIDHWQNPSAPYKPSKVLDYFENTQVRDPLPLQPHDFVGHGPDMYRMENDPRPIRGGNYPPYHIEGVRMEALAVASEEILMHLGLLDKRPRAREILYNLLAFRAARAIADLKMHSNEFTYMEAFNYVCDATPNNWVPREVKNSPTLWGDLDLYLRQPCYGVGYLIGSVQVQQLIADRAMQLGDKFTIKGFFDDYLAPGVIPISLIRWEMTGLDDQIKKLW